MENVKKKITYRQKQSLATHKLIVDVSTELFLEHGYGPTTIELIAERAGLAVSTIYAIFKNKRGILRAIREAWHAESGQRDVYQSALEQTDSARRFELAARATRQQWETGDSMIAIYLGAAAVDLEAAAELKAALQGRRANLDKFIRVSEEMIRTELTLERAASLFRALTLAEVYKELVHIGGWTPDEYENWLACTLKQQLLN